MATKSISQLDTQAIANETDLFEVAIVDANSASGYASKKESAAAIADAIVGEYQYPLRITGTTAKTIAGAINELKNLVDLLPQFAIEVVQTLPVSDISTTTIYLVPASDPEQGNYYEEYIYVNNAWELVGTTAVDLTGYYTSAQVDTLLAAKANTSSLATVATSGAYSDLSGKPTIDTALDTTSTNAVENRAVAGAINGIRSDLQDKADIITNSASGAIASFSDGADNLPVKDLTINITAVQSGTGDPSPTNIRLISGWTGANVVMTGVNIYNRADKASEDTYYLDSTGTPVFNNSYYTSNFIKVKPYTYYYYAINGVPARSETMHNAPRIAYYTEQKEYISSSDSTGRGISFHTPSNCAYIKVPMYRIHAEYLAAMITEGTTAPTTYSAFGTTYPITWQDEAGTIYGGMINLTTGVLTAIKASANLGTLDWTYSNSRFSSSISDGKSVATAGYNTFMCEQYKPRPSANSAAYSDENNVVWQGVSTGGVCFVYIRDSAYTDPDDLKTAVSGVKLVYELATPLTYQLTPTEVKTLLGQNNIWADTGDSSVSYRADTKKYIDAKIAELQALILNS